MPSPVGFPSASSPAPGPASGAIRAIRATAVLRRAAGRVGGAATRVALLPLAAFHAWLFGDRLVDGTVLDPVVAVRWVAGALIAFGFFWLRRRGVPLLCGRRALVLWLLVALLHAHSAWTPASAASSATAREAATVALQAFSAAAMVAGLGLLALLVRRRFGVPCAACRWLAAPRPASPPSTFLLAPCGPRPPPCA